MPPQGGYISTDPNWGLKTPSQIPAPTATKSAPDMTLADDLTDVAIGTMKDFTSSLMSLGHLPGVRQLLDSVGVTQQGLEQARAQLRPKNPAEQFGAGISEMAQFATPIPGKLGTLATRALEAARTAGVTAAHDGGPGATAVNVGIDLAAPLIPKAMTQAARKLMQSAAKPPVKETAKALIKNGDVPVVDFLLKEGISVTPDGVDKLTAIIHATNQEIAEAVKSLEYVEISPYRAASRTNDTMASFANRPNVREDVATINRVTDDFLRHPMTTQGGAGVRGRAMTPAEAQAYKQGTYKELKEAAYGTMKSAEVEAKKAIARGLKEELAEEAAKAGVDLAGLNTREGAAITARDLLAKRVIQAGNGDPGALGWLASNPKAGLTYALFKWPGMKSMIARGLYQSAEKLSGIPATLLKSMVKTIVSEGGSE